MKLLWYLLHARKQRRHGLFLELQIVLLLYLMKCLCYLVIPMSFIPLVTPWQTISIWLYFFEGMDVPVVWLNFINSYFPMVFCLEWFKHSTKILRCKGLKTLSNIWTWLKEWYIVSYHVSIIIIMNELIPGKEYDLCVCRVCYDIWIQCLFVVDLLRMV